MSADPRPTFDNEAERALLGAMMLRPDACRAAATLRPEDFYKPSHADIFRAILACLRQGKTTDFVTVASELGAKLEPCGGMGYIVGLPDAFPGAAGGSTHHATIIASAARLRAVTQAGQAIAHLGQTAAIRDAEDVMSEAAALLSKALAPLAERDPMLGAAIASVLAASTKPREVVRFPHLVELRLTSGSLTVLAGLPSKGKTAYAVTSALAWAVGAPVKFYSYEMSPPEIAGRVLAQSCGLDLAYIDQGLTEAERADAAASVEHLDGLAFTLSARPLPLDALIADMTLFARAGGRVALIDYLQIMAMAGKGQKEYDALSEATRALKRTATTTDLTVVVLSQFNRGLYGGDGKPRIPTLGDLKGSGSIESDADNVVLIHHYEARDTDARERFRREGYVINDRDARILCHLDVAKARNGKTFLRPVWWSEEALSFQTMGRGSA